MMISSRIRVGNNVALGCEDVSVHTTCYGFITLTIPTSEQSMCVVELNRQDLREFLARTCPAFITQEKYQADCAVEPAQRKEVKCNATSEET